MQITISKPAQYIDLTPVVPSPSRVTSSISTPTTGRTKTSKKGKKHKQLSPVSPVPPETAPVTTPSAPTYDKITGYDGRKGDTLQIDSASFGLRPDQCTIAFSTCEPATFQAAEDPGDIRFIYREDTGYLYYNENGPLSGLGAGGIVAVFEGAPLLGTIYMI